MNKILFSVVTIFMFVICASSQSEEIKDKKEIRFGLLPYVSVTRLIKTFLPLKVYLERNTSYEVTFLTAPTFAKFVERTQSHQYDIVFTAPHFALLAVQMADYGRLVRFSRELAACVFVPRDSQAKSLMDLKGATISTPDSLAIVSVLGEAMLKNDKLQSTVDVGFKRTPSHNNVIISVANKSSEAGIVASTVYEQFVSKGINKDKFTVLRCSEPVPTAMFLANKSMSGKDKEILMTALMGFSQSTDGKLFFKRTPFKGMKMIKDNDMKILEKYMDELKARL